MEGDLNFVRTTIHETLFSFPAHRHLLLYMYVYAEHIQFTTSQIVAYPATKGKMIYVE